MKTWIAGEVLLASDLNAEYNNILGNGESLVLPFTGNVDFDGNSLLLDDDQDTHITADTDDRIDFAAGGFDVVRIDGTTASVVNGLDLVGKATGAPPVVKARGEANIGLTFEDSNGKDLLVLVSTASAVNELRISNAATGNAPILRASAASEADIGLSFEDSNGNEILDLVSVASAVNEVRLTNAAAGLGPALTATGGDTDIAITLSGKGAGAVRLGQATSVRVQLVADQPIADSNGNELIKFTKTASAINEITIANAAAGGDVTLTATGGDTDIDVDIVPKGAGEVKLNGSSLFGQHTIWVPAGAMEARVTTAPAVSGVVEIGTSLIALRTMDFATGADDHAGFAIQMPKSWDEGTLIAQFVWSTTGGQTGGLDGVRWFIRAGAYASNDVLTATLGTAVGAAAQNHSGTADDIMITAETAAITVAGSPGAEEWVYFEVYRDVSDAGDDLDIDARLHGVKIHYTTNALTDS